MACEPVVSPSPQTPTESDSLSQPTRKLLKRKLSTPLTPPSAPGDVDATVNSRTRSPSRRTPKSPKHEYIDSLTLPIDPEDTESSHILDRAVHVLATEATALSFVTRLYQTDPVAKRGLLNAVECIRKINETDGKLIVCGIGKSGIVGMKIVATMKSVGLAASFMHAAEAMHGDLGDIRKVREIPSLQSHNNELTLCIERRCAVHHILWPYPGTALSRLPH